MICLTISHESFTNDKKSSFYYLAYDNAKMECFNLFLKHLRQSNQFNDLIEDIRNNLTLLLNMELKVQNLFNAMESLESFVLNKSFYILDDFHYFFYFLLHRLLGYLSNLKKQYLFPQILMCDNDLLESYNLSMRKFKNI